MISNKFRKLAYSVVFFALTISYTNAQDGNVVINQDKNITTLLELKKNMSDEDSARYKIQIYNGNRQGAYKAQSEFNASFTDWKSSIHFEQPNFKIWIGSFRTRLEADRALKKIKKEFSSAFIFKPKK